jgi:hypothetical protein
MRKAAFLFLVACCLPFAHGQKTRFGQQPPFAKPGVAYPIKVHISGVRVRPNYVAGSWGCFVYADAIFDGKKVEFEVWTASCLVADVVPGDYQARLLKSPQNLKNGPIGWEYELLLPDRTVWNATVTGLYE